MSFKKLQAVQFDADLRSQGLSSRFNDREILMLRSATSDGHGHSVGRRRNLNRADLDKIISEHEFTPEAIEAVKRLKLLMEQHNIDVVI